MADEQRIPVGRVGGLVAANVAAVISHFVFAVVTAAQLPARYPSHFNAAGQPDRWSDSGGFGWYVLPLFAAVMAAVLTALALLLPRIPLSLVNMPRKEQFLQLSLAEQTPVIQYLIRFLLWISLLDTVLFVAIQWAMFRAALDGRFSHGWVVIVGACALYLVYIIWGTVRIYRMTRAATARLSRPGVDVGAPD